MFINMAGYKLGFSKGRQSLGSVIRARPYVKYICSFAFQNIFQCVCIHTVLA